MADSFDKFTGSGAISSHTSDIGDTWSVSNGTLVQLSGSGSIYCSSGSADYVVSSWIPPGTDYEVQIVLGAQFDPLFYDIGPIARWSGLIGSQSGYWIQLGFNPLTIYISRANGGVNTNLINDTVSVTPAVGDVVTLRVEGSGATVTITAFYNGIQIVQFMDSSSSRITTTGSAGISINLYGGADTDQDIIRAFWAGDVGGPSGSVSPSSAILAFSATQDFSAVGGLPNEILNWTSTNGSISGSPGAAITYTAPSSGTTDDATWVSADLPTHTSAASITLSESHYTPIASEIAGTSDHDTVVTSSRDTTGSDFIAMALWGYSGGSLPVPGDFYGNYWTLVAFQDNGISTVQLFYCQSPTVGPGHTFSGVGGGSYPAIAIRTFSGSDPRAFLDVISANTASNVNSFQPGSLTTTDDGTLLITCFNGRAANTITINDSFTAETLDFVSFGNFGGGLAYLIQDTAGTVNPTWSWSTAQGAVAIMAAFGPLGHGEFGSELAVLVLDHGGVGHTPGSLVLSLTWLDGIAPDDPVVFTATTPVGSFSSTITLTNDSSSTSSAVLTINSSVTPGTYTISLANDGRLLPQTLDFTVSAPLVEVIGSVAPHGNVLAFFARDISPTPTPYSVTAMNFTGCTLTINGGDPIPMDSMIPMYTRAGGDPYSWTFGGQPQEFYIIDDQGTGWSSTGPWGTTSIRSALYQLLTPTPGGAGSISYVSGVGTGIYSFGVETPLTPGGTYSLYRPWHDVYPGNATSVGGAATTSASYHIDDGSTIDDVADDQTTTGTYDEARLTFRLTKIITRVVAGTTLTVTLSKTSGSDTLYGDGLILILEPARLAQPGDVVVFNAPDNWLTTVIGSAGPTSITLTMETRESWIPVNPNHVRKLVLGYNLAYLNKGFRNSTYANQCKHGGFWSGGSIAVDGNQQLTAIGAGQTTGIGLTDNILGGFTQAGNSQDYYGVPSTLSPWTARFTIPTMGNPTVTFGAADTGFSIDPPYTGGSTGGEITFTQAFGSSLVPLFAQSVGLTCTSNGGTSDIIQNVWMGDPLTPPDWAMLSHPVLYDRLHGRFSGGFLRYVIAQNTIGNQISEWSHQQSPDNLNYASPSSILSVAVTAFGPITGHSDAIAVAGFCVPREKNWIHIRVSTSPNPHGLVTGNTPGFSGIDLSTAFDLHGALITGANPQVAVIDSTSFILQCGTDGSSGGGVELNTLANPVTMIGGETVSLGRGQNIMPMQDAAVIASENGMNMNVMIPLIASDDFANQTGICLSINLTPGLMAVVETGNEVWNDFTIESANNWMLWQTNSALYSTSGGAQGYQTDNRDEWHAIRTQHVAMQVRAGFTGIPEVRIEGHGTGATAHVTIAGGVVSAIILDSGGTGYTSAPTIHILGGSGTGATVTATVSGGAVTGFTSLSGGSGYVLTGRDPADIQPVFASWVGRDIAGAVGTVALRYNFPVPWISITTYLGNHPVVGVYPDTITALFNQLSIDDLVDVAFGLHTCRGNYYSQTKAQLDRLTGMGVTGTKLMSYESGYDNMMPWGDGLEAIRKSVRIITHPDAFWGELSRCQILDRDMNMSALNYFTLNNPSGMYSNNQWQAFFGDGQAVGTGDPSENATPWDLSTNRSQIGASHRTFMKMRSTLARKITAVSDSIAISSSAPPSGTPLLVSSFAFKLDSGSTVLGSGIYRHLIVYNNTAPQLVIFYADKDFSFAGGPNSGNYLVMYASNSSGNQIFRTTFDPFAGMAGDGLWHRFTLEWSEWNIVEGAHNGAAILSIDNNIYRSTDSGTMFPRANGNYLAGDLPSISNGVYFGNGNSLVGMSVSNIGIWQNTQFFFPGNNFTYTGTYNDITSLAAGIPAEVIETGTLVDVLSIAGTNPEPGFKGIFSAAVTGTSVVSGPDLGPPVSVVATPRFNGVGHTPGSVTVDFKWLNSTPLSGGVVLNCVPSIGSMVASSVTLTDGGGDTVSATINIPGSTPTTNYSLDVTNSSGIRSLSVPFSVSEATVEVNSTTGAKVLSNGNIIIFFPTKISDGTPLAISAFSLVGSTVAINGGTPIPLDNAIPAFTGAGGVANCWTLPKIQNSTQYRLDVDSTKSGPWSTTSQQSWIGGNFGVGTGGSGSTGYSTDPTATAVDTLTVIPGRLYSLYRVQRDIYPNNCTTVGGPATSHAQYRVLDGGITTDHADDQTVQGSFNGTRFLYRLTKVFTQRAITSTWVITLSNAAGANTLYSNGLILLLEEERFSVLTDTVVVNLADNAITTSFGTTAPATITCIMETMQSQSPFNPELPRNTGIGFNTRYLNTNKFGSMFANLIKESLGFSGSPFTYDSNFELNSIASGGTIACDYIQNATFFSSTYGNSHDYWGNVGTVPITPTARFTLPTGADPTIFFQVSNIGYTPAGYAYGPGNLDGQEGYNSGNEITFTQRTLTYNQAPGYSQPWTIWIKSNGGTSDVPQNLWVGDVNTPHDWTRMVHPSMYDRMHGRFPGGYLRWVLSLEILQSGIYEWDQQHSPNDAIYGATSYTVGGPITAIGPVSAGAETDMVNAIFGHNANRMVIKVTSPGHKFVTAILIDFQNIDWSGVVDTNGGSVDISACPIWIIRLDDDHFIAQIGSTSSSTVNNPTTLTGAMTLGGGETCYGYLGQNAMPIQDAVVMCSELLMNLWLQLPSLASDDMANKAGQCLATYLLPGLKCGLEFSNERWNNFTREWNAQNFLYAANQYLYNSTGGAQGYPCTGAAMWGSLRNNQLAMQLNAGFTGVPEVRVEGYGQGATATATIAGGVVSAITFVNGGTGYTSVPTVHIMGGSGTGATATATIDGSGHVTGFTLTSGGSGYVPTGRNTADVYPIFATFAFDNVNIPALADAALAYNFQVPYIALTTYVNNQPLTGDYAVAMGGYNISTLFDQCSVGDLADLFAAHFRYDDWSGATSNQIAYLESRGITGTQLLIYEGSVSIACPYGSDGVDMVRRAQEVVTHPSMYHTWLSMFQVFDHKHGIKALTYFTYNDPSGMNGNSQWQTFLSDSQPVGTGDLNEWLTPWDLSSVPSQIGGAQRFYATSPVITTQQVTPTTMAAMAAM